MVPVVVTGKELGRRIRAARELAGLRSPEALANAINEYGLGARTLRNLEAGKGSPYKPARDLDRIAQACGLPVGWFKVDIAAAIRAASPPDESFAHRVREEAERTLEHPDTDHETARASDGEAREG